MFNQSEIDWNLMLITRRTVALIQKAGQAIDSASTDLSVAMRSRAEDTLSRVARSPFGQDSEQALEQFRLVARLGQDLRAMEQQIRTIYGTATELSKAQQEALPDMVQTPDGLGAAARRAPAKQAAARSHRARARNRAHAAVSDVPPVNDDKLMNFLKSTLKTGEWTRLHGKDVSERSGLPVGSVGASMRRLLAAGSVKKGERGMYQLAG